MHAETINYCESHACVEPAYVTNLNIHVPPWGMVLLIMHCLKISGHSFLEAKMKKGFVKIKHLHKVMGKIFCFCVPNCLQLGFLVLATDHGMYDTRQGLAFPSYKCFQQCQQTSQVFLLTCMKLFYWFCNKLCQIHFHISHTQSLMLFRAMSLALFSFFFYPLFFSRKHLKNTKIKGNVYYI